MIIIGSHIVTRSTGSFCWFAKSPTNPATKLGSSATPKKCQVCLPFLPFFWPQEGQKNVVSTMDGCSPFPHPQPMRPFPHPLPMSPDTKRERNNENNRRLNVCVCVCVFMRVLVCVGVSFHDTSLNTVVLVVIVTTQKSFRFPPFCWSRTLLFLHGGTIILNSLVWQIQDSQYLVRHRSFRQCHDPNSWPIHVWPCVVVSF